VDLSGNAFFTNAGTLFKSSPSLIGTTNFGPQLTSSGTMDVQSGLLVLKNGGAGTGTSVWTAEANGTFDLDGGTLGLNPGAQFIGRASTR
jgi:hypothetical protein